MIKNKITDSYYDSMYVKLSGREIVWRCIVDYVCSDVGKVDTCLELGAGYCDFINLFPSQKKIAVDISSKAKNYASKNVSFYISSCTDLHNIKSNSVDLVFASNLFEHLSLEDLEKTFNELVRVLRKNGQLVIIQPNFALAYKEYFHDYTHKMIFTHISIQDFLETHGFVVTKIKPAFLPFSMQSKYSGKLIPSFLFKKEFINFYLYSPIKPFARQMYVVSRKK